MSKEENFENESEDNLKKREINKDSVLKQLDDMYKILNDEIEKTMKSTDKNKNTRVLKKLKKRLEKIQKDLPKMKKKTTRTNFSNSGFVKTFPITKETSDFLMVDPNMNLSRDDLQCALTIYIHLDPEEEREKKLKWAYLNKEGLRDLRNPKNRKLIYPDEALSSLLKYNEYKKNVDTGKEFNKKGIKILDSNMHYYTLTSLLQNCFK